MTPAILITGATGNTGKPLMDQLMGRGIAFRAMSREPGKLHKMTHVEWVAGDFDDPDLLRPAFKRIQYLYLCTPPHPDMLDWAIRLTDLAVEAGVRHIVKLSALGTDPNSPIGLLRAHAQAEDYIRKSGLNFTFLHPHWFMESLLRQVASIREHGAVYSPLGESRISPVSVQDVAAAAYAVLTGRGHEGQTYRLTGPEALSFPDIAAHFADVLERKVRYVETSFEAAHQSLLKAGLSPWLADNLVALNRSWKEDPGQGALLTDDVERLTGHSPKSLRELLSEYRFMTQNLPPEGHPTTGG